MIKKYFPQIHLIMVSAQKNIQVAIDALKYGASEYIMKDDNELDMISNATARILQENNVLAHWPDSKNKINKAVI